MEFSIALFCWTTFSLRRLKRKERKGTFTFRSRSIELRTRTGEKAGQILNFLLHPLLWLLLLHLLQLWRIPFLTLPQALWPWWLPRIRHSHLFVSVSICFMFLFVFCWVLKIIALFFKMTKKTYLSLFQQQETRKSKIKCSMFKRHCTSQFAKIQNRKRKK